MFKIDERFFHIVNDLNLFFFAVRIDSTEIPFDSFIEHRKLKCEGKKNNSNQIDGFSLNFGTHEPFHENESDAIICG